MGGRHTSLKWQLVMLTEMICVLFLHNIYSLFITKQEASFVDNFNNNFFIAVQCTFTVRVMKAMATAWLSGQR